MSYKCDTVYILLIQMKLSRFCFLNICNDHKGNLKMLAVGDVWRSVTGGTWSNEKEEAKWYNCISVICVSLNSKSDIST